MSVKLRKLLFHKATIILMSILLITCVAITAFVFSPLHATKAATRCGYPISTPTLSYGSSGDSVVTLQYLLNEAYEEHLFSNSPHNFHPLLAEDGSFGPNTQAAVEDFQTRYKSQVTWVDGIVGPKTWNALLSATAPYCTYLQ
jgi:peptidoglycan hydrolase-like protein with peptidoglycan-binding domain